MHHTYKLVIYNTLLFISLWYICLDCAEWHSLENGPSYKPTIYAANSRNLSTDGHGTNGYYLHSVGMSPLLEEPPGYYAYNEPALGLSEVYPNKPQKQKTKKAPPRDVANPATYDDPGWMDPTSVWWKKTYLLHPILWTNLVKYIVFNV